MILIEKLKQVSTIYTHAHCPDGMATAMILKDAFRMLGMAPRIEFLVHNTREHANAGRVDSAGNVVGPSMFCDICPHLEAVDTLKAVGDVIVLDHHKGTRDIVEAFGENGVYADAVMEPGVSGATLAFREVWDPCFHEVYRLPPRPTERTATEHDRDHEHQRTKEFAECSGIRDCWVTSDPRFLWGQWISKMLMAKPASYWLDDGEKGRPLLPYLNAAETEGGRCLYEAHMNAVAQAVDQCMIFDIAEQVVLYVFQEQACGHRLTSDVAEATRVRLQGQGSDHLGMVAGFSYVVDKPGDNPKLSWSLRGLNGFDVQKFAQANGGNGHTAAAGFATKIDGPFRVSPYVEICNRLNTYLVGTP